MTLGEHSGFEDTTTEQGPSLAGKSVTNEIFRQIVRLGMVYVVLQVVVGVETGLMTVALYFAQGVSLPQALTTVLPLGLPLLLVQGGGYLAFQRHRRRNAQRDADAGSQGG